MKVATVTKKPLTSKVGGMDVPVLRDEKGRFLPKMVCVFHHLMGLQPEPLKVIRPTPTDPIYVGVRSGKMIGRL